jgi:hypothetical protein
MHPDFEDPASELHRIRELGLIGFKMHPEYQSCAPDDERMRPILETASDLGLIAFFHAGADVGPKTLLGNPAAFARMIDEHPKLSVVLAHFGGFRCWDEVAEHLVGRDLWLDTAYTLGHLDDARFLEIARAHGTDRVIFGSDGPWTNPARELEHLARIGFDDAELEAILGGNAQRLLFG